MSHKENDKLYDLIKENKDENNAFSLEVTCSVCKKSWLYGLDYLENKKDWVCPDCTDTIKKDLDEWEHEKIHRRKKEELCTCNDKIMDYCPAHDGDYGEWKFGRYGEEFDEYHEEDFYN